MNRADIKTIASFLSLIPPNDDTLTQFIEDLFNQLGMSPDAKLVKAAIIKLTAATQTYSFPADCLKILEAFYDDAQIHLVTNRDLEAYSRSWRTDTDDPLAITQDEESSRQYTLYPIPSTTSDTLIPIHGQPFGEDFPDNSLTLIYADNRDSDIPDIFTLPIALESLAREFSYPSDHTDTAFADSCHRVAVALFALIGVPNA